jgi:hypothetical protein
VIATVIPAITYLSLSLVRASSLRIAESLLRKHVARCAITRVSSFHRVMRTERKMRTNARIRSIQMTYLPRRKDFSQSSQSSRPKITILTFTFGIPKQIRD